MNDSASGRKCLKCGYVRKQADMAPDYECPGCGAVYAKVEAFFLAKQESCVNGESQRQTGQYQQDIGKTSRPPEQKSLNPLWQNLSVKETIGILVLALVFGSIYNYLKEPSQVPSKVTPAKTGERRKVEVQGFTSLPTMLSRCDGDSTAKCLFCRRRLGCERVAGGPEDAVRLERDPDLLPAKEKLLT